MNVAFLGYGTVGRALRALLDQRREALNSQFDLELMVTGVAMRRRGWIADAGGLDPDKAIATDCGDIERWLDVAVPDVVFETIALNPHTGQPALDYSRLALQRGIPVISANKGPVVHGYHELTALAARTHASYRFESAVMDGAPVFSLVRECLPLLELNAIRGVFSSTATVVLEAVEQGGSFDDGIRHAQQLGIAEADPAYDVDGWDSAVKLCALANVLMAGALVPADVARTGIRDLAPADVRRAHAAGAPLRLVGEVRRTAEGLQASVRPLPCDNTGTLGVIRGATLVTHFEADVFPGGLTVTSRDPDPTTTAYGLLSDFVGIVRDINGPSA